MTMFRRLSCSMRAMLVLWCMLAAVLTAAPIRAATRPVSAILMDAGDGSILYAENAGIVRRPASLTKMMTLYLLFDALDAGTLRLGDPVRISRYAASQPPSRVGLRPGATMTIDQAIRAIAVVSANDVAVALAETMGGTEDRFARMMTAFERGDPVSIDGKAMSPATILTKLNELGRANGIGRLDLVENRFVGMKSRGVYETPGGTILYAAHRGIESITLDRGAGHLKDELMPKYAELVYNGFWFTPEREMLQALIDKSQEYVAGTVRMKLYKGNTTVVGRSSPYSLYRQDYVTFEKDSVYNQKDAEGFIKLNALRLRLLAARNQSVK